jgi:hypothetical protein
VSQGRLTSLGQQHTRPSIHSLNEVIFKRLRAENADGSMKRHRYSTRCTGPWSYRRATTASLKEDFPLRSMSRSPRFKEHHIQHPENRKGSYGYQRGCGFCRPDRSIHLVASQAAKQARGSAVIATMRYTHRDGARFGQTLQPAKRLVQRAGASRTSANRSMSLVRAQPCLGPSARLEGIRVAGPA